MKVLVIHNRYRSAQPSGENTVVDEEVSLLRNAGHEVETLVAESDEIATASLSQKALLPGRVIWSRSAQRVVHAQLQMFSPHVVHVHNTFPLLSPSVIWTAAKRAPVVQTFHNFRPLCPASTFLREGAACEACVGRAAVPSVLYGCYRGSRLATLPLAASSATHRRIRTWDRVAATICPSAFSRSKFLSAGWPANRVFVKPNTAADVQPLPWSERRGFVYVGRLSGEKGVDTLIDAWRRAALPSDEPLTIVGSGPDAEQLERRARDCRTISFAGLLAPADAMARLGHARFLVVPSRCYEVFPRVVVEAYARGVPVVASRIGSLGEIVRDRVTGRQFPVADVDALASVLSQLTGADRSGPALAEGAREEYDRLYRPDRTLTALLGIYEFAQGAARVAP